MIGPPGLILVQQQPSIGVVASLADLPRCDRGEDRATRLLHVAAVVEGAPPEVVAHLREALRQLLRRDVPETELAQPRRVGDVPAARPFSG